MFKGSISSIVIAGLALLGCDGSRVQAGGPGGQGGANGACAIDTTTPGAKTAVASVHVTASTNTGTIDVTVFSDGSAERTTGPARFDAGPGLTPQPMSFPAGSPEVMTFLCDLAAAGRVSQIPTTNSCAKSVSFGTEMTVAVGPDSSGDLECLATTASAAAMALAHDCDVLTGRRS
jgi:hypothetical protein